LVQEALQPSLRIASPVCILEGIRTLREIETPPEHAVAYLLRVRYFETDQMGVVHHANYPVWFEAARSEFCRVHGIDYAQMERDGMILPVMELQVRYISPARYEDEITVHSWVAELRRSLLTVRYHVARGDTLLATGQTLQMLIDRDTNKPRRFSADIAARFTGHLQVEAPEEPQK
jgi:acyl-CoA thioester hydrolase